MIEFGEGNVDLVVDSIERFIDSFDFLVDVEDHSLGHDIAMMVVDGIIERNREFRGATVEWKENEPKYAKYKEKHYGVADSPNTRTGDMLSQRALYGRTTIEPELITMIYGTNDIPTRCAYGGELKNADKKRTDVEKAYFAHTGQSIHKIKRPFYELDDAISADVQERIGETLNDFIVEQNRQRRL